MSGEKNGSYKGLTEARRRANKKYNDRFVEIKVRAGPLCAHHPGTAGHLGRERRPFFGG